MSNPSNADFRLEAAYHPAPEAEKPGSIKLTLYNIGTTAIANFSLTWSALTRVRPDGEIAGGRFIRRVGNLHEVAFTDRELAPGGRWTITLSGLSHVPRHRLDGPKSAYLTGRGAHVMPVDVGDMMLIGGADSGELKHVPEGRIDEPLGLTPWPQDVAVTAYGPVGLIAPSDTTSADDIAAMARVAALAHRLHPAAMKNFCLDGQAAARHLSFAPLQDKGAGAYEIRFDGDAITLAHGDATGRDHGLITLAQAMHAANTDPRFRFPVAGTITDAPRFGWRGMHLDVSRHFRDVGEVMRLLDIMAWLKLNVFHWHLTDDEGWRLEILAFPELTRFGAERGPQSLLPGQGGFTDRTYGGYYSQADVREIVAHAASLNISIMPEIDIPGHSDATLAALPMLRDPNENGNSYHSIQGYGNNALNPALPATYEFLGKVLDEMAALFPGDYIHVGGDEVANTAWLASPAAQAMMAEHGLAGTFELQAHFLGRVRDMIQERGKKMAGWDEISYGGGVAGALVNTWQKTELTKSLIGEGYEVVACPGQAYYLDMVQGSGWMEPGTSWAGVLTPRTTYMFDAADGLTDTEAAHLKGIQACIWSEHLIDRARFNYMVFPRLAAIAESAWTDATGKSWDRFAALCRLIPEL